MNLLSGHCFTSSLMQSAKVYIDLLNYKKWEDCRDCLQSVLRSTYNNFAVFVVDNDSGNQSLEHLILWYETEIGAGSSPGEHQNSYVLLTSRNLDQRQDPSIMPKVVFIQNDENRGFAAGLPLTFLWS